MTSAEITVMHYNGAGYIVRRDHYPAGRRSPAGFTIHRVGIRQGVSRRAGLSARGSGFAVRTYESRVSA